MPQPRFREVAGDVVSSDQLDILRAREFAQLVEAGATPYATLVACKRNASGDEVVVVDLRPTVPQRPKVAIRRNERVSVEFKLADDWYPDVRALREDFPRERVLHLNGGIPEAEAPSLCLFAEPWPDVRLHLTANELLFRLQNWFDDTASGKLHRPDQPLEPTFLAQPHLLIVHQNIGDRLSKGNLTLNLDIIQGENRVIFIEHRPDRFIQAQGINALVVPVVSHPFEHSLRLDVPKDLSELHNQLGHIGIDLLQAVQIKLISLGNKIDKYSHAIILILLKRQRSEHSEPESEVIAFVCIPPRPDPSGLHWLKAAVGLSSSGAADMTKRGESVPVPYLSVQYELSPSSASNFSGLSANSATYVAIGGGAIGSQFLMTAVRGGLGSWTIIDNDILLPHNLVRHSLIGHWLGRPKVEGVAFEANSILDAPCVTPLVADILNPKERYTAVQEAFSGAEAIVDLSASVAVARHIACDIEGTNKRCSIFVSPSGNDLVFLGEDSGRVHRLDIIEAQYYREVAQNLDMQEHWQGGSIVGSCRDITSRIPQNMMSIHSAQAERIFRNWLNSADSKAVVVRGEKNSFGFKQVLLPLNDPIHVGVLGGWMVLTDHGLLDSLFQQRGSALPNETGGVLLAHVDAQRKTLYVCHQIPAPPDSQRQPTVYIRGSEGLAGEYARIRETTLNTLGYIGEWHSHPNGSACSPSGEDLRAGAWLAEQMRPTSLPGIMLILGDGRKACWMLCEQGGTTSSPILLSLSESSH